VYLRSTDQEKWAIDLATNPASMFFANEVNTIKEIILTRDDPNVSFPVNLDITIVNSNIWPS
jgi:hypothetical protein